VPRPWSCANTKKSLRCFRELFGNASLIRLLPSPLTESERGGMLYCSPSVVIGNYACVRTCLLTCVPAPWGAYDDGTCSSQIIIIIIIIIIRDNEKGTCVLIDVAMLGTEM